MKIQIEPEFNYSPAEGDYGGSQSPSEADVELTGIEVLDDNGEELKTPPVEMVDYFLDNYEEQLVKRAFEMVEEQKDYDATP